MASYRTNIDNIHYRDSYQGTFIKKLTSSPNGIRLTIWSCSWMKYFKLNNIFNPIIQLIS